jgi:hypothetical protein
MSWIKVADRTPPENEQVLIHDERNNRIESGRFIDGEWFIEDAQSGQLSKIVGVTHWAWILDSYVDHSDDD